MHPAVHEARRLAKQHRMKVVTVKERRDPRVPGDYIDAYVVYRFGARVGRRRDPAELLRWVRELISTVPPAQGSATHAAT